MTIKGMGADWQTCGVASDDDGPIARTFKDMMADPAAAARMSMEAKAIMGATGQMEHDLARINEIQSQARQHKHEAEHANIVAAENLTALVDLSAEQQKQLTRQAGLMAEQAAAIAELVQLAHASEARAEAAEDTANERWRESRNAQRWGQRIAFVGAVFAALAVWAAFAASQTPVVNVPAPVVVIPTTTTAVPTTTTTGPTAQSAP